MERKRPRNGEIYTHFKGQQYQVLCTAVHTETEEELVVYQALYGNQEIYARPLEMFLSIVDKNKYPDAAQVYRFELCKEIKADAEENKRNPLIFDFLELEENEERAEFLQRNKKNLDSAFLSAAAESLEYTENEGTLEERYQDLIKFLKTKMKYEGRRLR